VNGATKPEGDSYFHGWVYRTFIDPALVPIREAVGNWIPDGSAVVDIGCGTGAQLFALGDRVVRGLGVDRSRTQIEHARRQAARLGLSHLEFWNADATHLDSLQDGEFDIAVTSMVIHEMPSQIRLPVLTEMRRIARRLIVVDWEARQRTLLRRIGAHIIERLAGGEHYKGFRSFTENGGIPELIKQTDLAVIDQQETSKGTMRLWLCS
jgi:ubiquinone/menaquinone biosynthesis C-methylase UbiE